MPTSKQIPADVPTPDQLKARRAAGETVTVDEWARARAKAELDEVDAILAAQAAAEQVEQEKRDAIRVIGDQLVTAFDDDGDAADLDAIRDAVASICRRASRRQEAFDDAFATLGSQGVRVDEFEPIAGTTRHNAGMGLNARITIDGRTITCTAPGRTIADALVSGLADAGKVRGYLAPSVVVTGQRKRRQETPEQAQQRERMRLDMLATMQAQQQAATVAEGAQPKQPQWTGR